MRIAARTRAEYSDAMRNLNITLPDDLQSFVERQVAERGYVTCDEFIRDLIRREQDIQQLRAKLLEGAASGPAVVADDAYFEGLYQRIDNKERS